MQCQVQVSLSDIPEISPPDNLHNDNLSCNIYSASAKQSTIICICSSNKQHANAMKTILLLLAVLVIFDGCVPCKEPPGCLTGFCHPGNWHDCCCPAGCLGLIVGGCYGSGSKDVNGVITYSIFDKDNKKLMHDTVVLDKSTVASQEQVDKIIALYGNQTLYLDAHLDLYDVDAIRSSIHKSWRHFKIN